VGLVLYAASLFFRRKGFFVWAECVVFCLFCPIFFLHPNASLPLAFALSLSFLFLLLLFAPLLLIRSSSKKQGEKHCRLRRRRVAFVRSADRATTPVARGLGAENFQDVLPMPEFNAAQSVRFDYAFEVVQKLERAKLNGRDRMEISVIRDMLTVYRTKERLTREEFRSLNGYLSALLKLMAAYSV
jgi:hypothetical protein